LFYSRLPRRAPQVLLGLARQSRGAQEVAAISPSGAITRLTHRRDSDLIMCVFLNH